MQLLVPCLLISSRVIKNYDGAKIRPENCLIHGNIGNDKTAHFNLNAAKMGFTILSEYIGAMLRTSYTPEYYYIIKLSKNIFP